MHFTDKASLSTSALSQSDLNELVTRILQLVAAVGRALPGEVPLSTSAPPELLVKPYTVLSDLAAVVLGRAACL